LIIQIRGTSGSGKTHAMRATMSLLSGGAAWMGVRTEVRRQPLYYINNYAAIRKLPFTAVLGHYESACGGCDNIGSAARVYELLTTLAVANPQWSFLCEGLLLSEDVKWTSQLPDVRVIFLTTPLETCIAQIEKRRKEAGNEKPLNRKNTENRVAVIERARLRLEEAGAYCVRAQVSQVPHIIQRWLGEA